MASLGGITFGLLPLILFGCAIDDRELFQADEDGVPIVRGGEDCGEGAKWINDGIGYYSDADGVVWRGQVRAQASGDGSRISPTEFESAPACVTGNFGDESNWAAIRWNIAQDYDEMCQPGVARSVPLPGGGITFQGSADGRVRIVISETTSASSRYWCVIPQDPPASGSPIDVPWSDFVENCDSSVAMGSAYADQPITTIQIEPVDDNFDMCVEFIRPHCPDGCSEN